MKVLVVTDVLWRNDNGVGNSYSNIFADIDGVTVANICCQTGASDNTISTACFQISESGLLKSLLHPHVDPGMREDPEQPKTETKESSAFVWIKRSRLQIFLWMRELIWQLGQWKSDGLKAFIDDFQPDIVFTQLQDKRYLSRLARFVADYANVPLVAYAWDDVYSLRQFSLSPLFWIDRLLQRRSIRKLAKRISILYTICQEQKEEYERTLNVRTELLYKGYPFATCPEQAPVGAPVRLLYTGNLYSGRYKTLLRLCKTLAKNADQLPALTLDIYSATPLTSKEIAALNTPNISAFHGKISESQVQKLQKQADVLLHIEPFSLKGSLLCRLSFSTKLVDYFHHRKCIFAVGPLRCASMQYLRKNQAAVVACSLEEAEQKLPELLKNPEDISRYGQNAWNCGEKNHRITAIQKHLLTSMKEQIS